MRRWYRPDRRFLNVYGPTEATVTAIWTTLHPDRPATLGEPLPTYTVLILAPDEPRLLEPGEQGEIAIAGIGLAREYLNRPERTAQAFIPDFVGLPENPSGRLYRTGDLGAINADGEVEYHGRIDDQVKVRCYRIELTEIESVLLQLPGVAQAVVATHDPGTAAVELVAYYSLRRDAAVTAVDVYRHLAEALPVYMLLAYLEQLGEVPLLPSDKADRKSLPAPSSRGRVTASADVVAPRDETEARLATVLGLSIDEVSVHSEFLAELGANPLVLFRGTPLYSLYLRALGARIGPGVVILTRNLPVCADLLTIGAHTIVRKNAFLNCYRGVAGAIETGSVTIGAHAVIGEGAVLDIASSLGQQDQLGHASGLQSGQAIPAGEHWHGSPAEPTDVDYLRVEPARVSRLRKVMVSLTRLLPLLLVYLPVGLMFDGRACGQHRPVDGHAGAAGFLPHGCGGVRSGSARRGRARHRADGGVESVTGEAGPAGSGVPALRLPFRATVVGVSHQQPEVLPLALRGQRLHPALLAGARVPADPDQADRVELRRAAAARDAGAGVRWYRHDGLRRTVDDQRLVLQHVVSIRARADRRAQFPQQRGVVPAGARTGDNVLLATKVLVPMDGAVRENTGLLGAPAFEIPRTVQGGAERGVTDGPEQQWRALRGKRRHSTVTIALFLLSRWVYLFGLVTLAMLADFVTCRRP